MYSVDSGRLASLHHAVSSLKFF